ncbi:hypothetical protein [Haloterrigena alkaliphila]|uniref:hypothetical protein n=1 Tax=Haloterrigena alkaliphila TaxID=2816475 RepID=UPI001CFF7AAD|nr:hypothetical protein [Haloterrigena alkaliphila]UHQ95097.1 hypothetical protein J0X25_19780 [Haloterrigena alkaliphila]
MTFFDAQAGYIGEFDFFSSTGTIHPPLISGQIFRDYDVVICIGTMQPRVNEIRHNPELVGIGRYRVRVRDIVDSIRNRRQS